MRRANSKADWTWTWKSLLLLATTVCRPSLAQITAPPPPLIDAKNAVAASVSIGAINGRDAEFWGWAIDYSRRLSLRWSANLGLTWDKETERRSNAPDAAVSTYTIVGTVSYTVTDWFSVTSGIGKGIADDDNAAGRTQFKDGDWSTGIAFGFATPGLPSLTRDTIGISIAYEYNFNMRETSVSADLSFGWSF